MRRVLLLAANDVRRTVRDRASLLWMLALPVALMWFFGQFGGGGTPAKARLTVIDRDGGWVARVFIAQLAGPGIEVVEIAAVEAARPENSKKVRTLEIPAEFTSNVLSGHAQPLRIEKDKGAAGEFSLAADADVLRAIVRTLALLSEMKETGVLAGGQEAFMQMAARAPLVRLDVSTAGSGQAVPSGRAQSVPGILTMTVMMMTVISGGVFLAIERRDGTLRRQLAAPVSPAGIFAAKILGRLFVAGLQIGLLLAVGRFLFGISFGSSPIGLFALLAAYAFSAAGLATLVGSAFRTPEQAASIGWLGSMVMSALGGCWWPSEVVPRWLWKASHVFPTAWAMDAFHALISFGRGAGAVAAPVAALTLFGMLFSALGAWCLGLRKSAT